MVQLLFVVAYYNYGLVWRVYLIYYFQFRTGAQVSFLAIVT